MKTENKKDDDFEVDPIITFIAMLCAIATMILGYDPQGDLIELIIFYVFGTFVFTIGYIILFHLLVAIIVLPIAFIICLFSKNK